MADRPLIPPFSGIFSVTCSKCTKQARFAGRTLTVAAEQAKAKGWTMPVEDRYNCPRCSKVFGTRGQA